MFLWGKGIQFPGGKNSEWANNAEPSFYGKIRKDGAKGHIDKNSNAIVCDGVCILGQIPKKEQGANDDDDESWTDIGIGS